MEISLSIIIVTYNSNHVITDCLESIDSYNDIGESLEVIVIDNSPVFEISNIIRSLTLSFEVKYAHNPENKGFGQGCNIGASLAKGTYLLFLNPDIIMIEPYFNYVINLFSLDPKLAACGLVLLDENRRTASNSFGFMPEKFRLLPSSFYILFVKYLNFSPTGIFPLGANLFIRAKLFYDAGKFDESLFLCYEEPDLIRRLPKSSNKVKVFNKSLIHLGGHTTGEIGEMTRLNESLKSERYYFSKHKLNYKRYALNNLIFKVIKIIVKPFAKLSITDKALLKYYYSALTNKETTF